jgi:hypothetical protein
MSWSLKKEPGALNLSTTPPLIQNSIPNVVIRCVSKGEYGVPIVYRCMDVLASAPIQGGILTTSVKLLITDKVIAMSALVSIIRGGLKAESRTPAPRLRVDGVIVAVEREVGRIA